MWVFKLISLTCCKMRTVEDFVKIRKGNLNKTLFSMQKKGEKCLYLINVMNLQTRLRFVVNLYESYISIFYSQKRTNNS